MYQNWLICISVINWRCTKIGTLTFKGLIKNGQVNQQAIADRPVSSLLGLIRTLQLVVDYS